MFEKTRKKIRTVKAQRAYQKMLDENPRHITYVPAQYPNRRARRAMAKMAKKS